MKRIAMLLITVILLAAGCGDGDVNQGISEPSSLSQSLHEPSDTSQPSDEASDENQLPDYLQAYEEFLRGERLAKDGVGEFGLWDCGYYVESLDEFHYALFDMNRDDIPELHLRKNWWSVSYWALTYYDNELRVWYSGTGYEWPTDDGAILYHRPGAAPPHDTYQYKELDFYGNTIHRVIFERYDVNMDDAYDELDDYYFDHEVVPKEEWDVLTEPYLSATSDLIEWIQLSDDFTHIQ